MAFKKIPLTIDTMIRNPVPVEGINQEDNTELNIVVTENKTPKDLSSQTIKVYVRRIDGTLVEQTDQITPTNASKGEVTVKLKNSAFNKEGYALFQLDISDSTGRITSSYATFKIGKGLVSAEAIANTNEVEALKKIEEYIKKANQELETFKQTVAEINENEATRQENEVVRVREEASRNEAEAIRAQQEATRKEKENERVQAEIKRIADEEMRRENEVLRGSKELERKQAEELRKETEFLRIEDENNRKVAESKRIEAESVRVEAEKLRVAAETGRVGAESLRVTAEEKRVVAETKREEEFNKFEGRISANTEELKNARSATTGEKFNTLDERIDCEVDRLNKNIEVSMLQQEDKENHTIENTVEGMTTDMVVKGKTLVNVVKSNRRICKKGASAYFQLIYPKLKMGTYTVIINASELTKEGITMYDMINSVQYPYGLKTGLNIRKIDVREEGSTYAIIVGSDNVDGTQFMLESLLILEGDWTNKPIPEYFEGIKSFGQQEDKISTLSCGKNLFNINGFKSTSLATLNNGLYTTPMVLNSYSVSNLYSNENKGKLLLKPNTTYICSALIRKTQGTGEMNYLSIITSPKNSSVTSSAKGNWLSKPTLNSNFQRFVYKFTTGNNVYVDYFFGFQVSQEAANLLLELKEIQIEQSEKFESYQEYKEDKKDILLSQYSFDEGLRGFDLNVCDELNDIKNVAIKRVGKKIITSELPITLQSINVHGIASFAIPIDDLYNDRVGFCNKLILQDTLIADTITEGFTLSVEVRGAFIRVKSEKASNVEEFKQYLATLDEPIVIYYPCEPVETHLSENINLKTFREKTYVSFENTINGTSSFKAPVNAVATISRLNRENRALEEENRSLRQDFESTTLSLTDSDLELVKQNVDMDFRLMEVEFALDIPQAILSSNINFKNKKGEVKSMARTPYEMMKIVILSGDYDREDYMHKVGKYYERGRMSKEEHDELMSLMTADEVIGG